MGEVYSALKEDVPARLAEAERVGYGFELPKEFVPNVPEENRVAGGIKKFGQLVWAAKLSLQPGVATRPEQRSPGLVRRWRVPNGRDAYG